MFATTIGISSGLLVIFLLAVLKYTDKQLIYGLVLSGIGFLYVGFTWSDQASLIITALQAISFVLLALYGMKKNLYFLSAGYFLHGIWDLLYELFQLPDLIPPHYDLFCLSIDFTIGIYLSVLEYRHRKQNNQAVILLSNNG